MKLHTRICALLLGGAMLFSLAACNATGSETPDPTPSVSPSETVAPSPSTAPDASDTSDSILPEDFVADTSVEDLCLATAGIPGEFPLLTINGNPVSAYAYLYWLRTRVNYWTTNLAYYGLPLDWENPFLTGTPLADYLKEDAFNYALQTELIISNTKKLGYELTEEQQTELDTTVAFTIGMMGGEEAFLDALRKDGVDYDTLYNLNAVGYYFEQLYSNHFPGHPTEEELDTYIEENDVLSAKHILFMTVDSITGEALDEATVAQKKALAEDVLAQLQASSDLPADFDTLMFQYSEDGGLISNPDGYIFTAGEMVPEFEEGTRALEYGQISGLVETTYGYHIILRQDPDTETTRTDCLKAMASELLQTWMNEAEIVFSEEYETLDVRMFHEKHNAYLEAFTAEDEAAASENTN